MAFMDYGLKVRESLEYIEKNLNNKIILDDLAKKAYLSKYHYHRLFHKIVGESVNKYISKRRMEKAACELIRTDERIIDIAFKYQYGSQESFSRAFKRVYAVAPGEYRREFVNGKSSIGQFNAENVVSISVYRNQIKDIAA